jgi:hypothetical protein
MSDPVAKPETIDNRLDRVRALFVKAYEQFGYSPENTWTLYVSRWAVNDIVCMPEFCSLSPKILPSDPEPPSPNHIGVMHGAWVIIHEEFGGKIVELVVNNAPFTADLSEDTQP